MLFNNNKTYQYITADWYNVILYLLNPLNYWGGLLLISTVSQNLQCAGPLPQENSDL